MHGSDVCKLCLNYYLVFGFCVLYFGFMQTFLVHYVFRFYVMYWILCYVLDSVLCNGLCVSVYFLFDCVQTVCRLCLCICICIYIQLSFVLVYTLHLTVCRLCLFAFAFTVICICIHIQLSFHLHFQPFTVIHICISFTVIAFHSHIHLHFIHNQYKQQHLTNQCISLSTKFGITTSIQVQGWDYNILQHHPKARIKTSMTKIVGNKQDPTETQHHLQSTNLIHLSSHCFLKVVHSLQQPRNDLNRSSTHRGIKPGDKPTTWLHLSIRSKSRKTTLKENHIKRKQNMKTYYVSTTIESPSWIPWCP